jgi:hypothetical protein
MEGPRLLTSVPLGPHGSPGASHELQQLWFATQQRAWSSLAVIPARPGSSARFVGDGLVEIGALHRGVPVKLIDGEGAEVAASARLVLNLSSHVAAGGLAIAVLDSVIENQAGIPVALASDALLITIDLGRASQKDLQRTLALLGSERVLGVVAVRKKK